jgi:hypothetical protein
LGQFLLLVLRVQKAREALESLVRIRDISTEKFAFLKTRIVPAQIGLELERGQSGDEGKGRKYLSLARLGERFEVILKAGDDVLRGAQRTQILLAATVDIGQHGVERDRTLPFKFGDMSLQTGDGFLEGGVGGTDGIENIGARGEGNVGSSCRRRLDQITIGS